MSEYRSSLTGPPRGVGSGIPQNQAVSGSLDPDLSARLSSLPAEDLQKALDVMEKASARKDSLLLFLEEAEAEGSWSPPKPLELASLEELESWSETLKTKEAEEETPDLRSLGIGADHPLYNPMTDTARRKRIEENVSEMDFDEMVFTGYCDQEVPIKNRFTVVFRTLPTQHGLWLEIMLAEVNEGSEQYLRHKFSLLQLAASLQKINGKPVGSNLSKFLKEENRGDFIKAINKRLEYLGRLPSPLTDDLIVNYTWFCGRVRKMLSDDVGAKVGNS